MLSRLWITCIVTVITIGVSASTASAQASRQVEVFGGYVNLPDYESLHGGSLQVSAGISPKWAVVLDVDAAYRHVRAFYEPYNGAEFRELHIAGLAGFRSAIGRRGRFSGHWQILAGSLQTKTFDVCTSFRRDRPCRPEEDSAAGYFVVQPGLGATVMATPRFGIRAQADLRIGGPDGRNYEYPFAFFRAVAGGVIRLGKTN